MSDNARFYADLEPFRSFEDFADFSAYRPVPADWVVLAGDIQGSTRAIAEGRYKEVNLLGAAVITAVLNACKGADVPYVFGGDGGAVVVPAACAEAGARALQALQSHAEAAFGMRLRAAAVPAARLAAEGHALRVRRLVLSGANSLALFAGDGLARVDEILKGGADPALLHPVDQDGPPDLTGLSCRWEPLSAHRGRMIALMVQPVGSAPESTVYREVLQRLAEILDQDIPAHAPASDATLRFRWPPRGLGLEVRALGGRTGAWATALASSLAQLWCHWRGARIGSYDGPRYLEEMKAQTDFRKFDGCLRAVLDCTEAQVAAIEAWLEAEHRAGRLVYGLHVDRTALMTCLVFSLAQSRHVHFVDAAGGGFARAAEGFKARLRARPAGG